MFLFANYILCSLGMLYGVEFTFGSFQLLTHVNHVEFALSLIAFDSRNGIKKDACVVKKYAWICFYAKIRLSTSALRISSRRTWKSSDMIDLRSSTVHKPPFSPLMANLSKVRMAEFILALSMALRTVRALEKYGSFIRSSM
mmetsp:Transcript_10966/g.16329  ORF Transcript_10966/g.16329 Transcript_10966/m.16329 type:complete len:142 (-) Transcript_10966:1240-1665(-)